MRTALAAASGLASLLLAGAAAAQTAPLPPGWTMSADDPPGEYERPRGTPAGTLRGIYGHGVANPLEPDSFDLGAEGTNPVCRGDRAAQEAYLRGLGDHGLHFWFYGTGSQSVMFRREAQIPADRPCAQGILYSYRIERGFVADGYVHTMEVNEDGTADYFSSRAIGNSDDEYSGGFEPLHNLMARDERPRRGRASNDRVAGVPVRCWSGGAEFVWNQVCVSRSGPTRGMILSSGTGDDSQTLFRMEFLELDPDAVLDARLFDLERSWTPPR
jgi:hypothetical protein